MAVAYDASSSSSQTVSNVNASWTHTPTGTPRGALVLVYSTQGADMVTGVTYGGVAMTEISGSPNVKAASESMSVYAYFLGSGIPTGAQTVQVSVNGDGFSAYRASAFTVTANGNTEVVDSDGTINSDSVANPSVTLSLTGRTCWCAIGFMSGQGAVTGVTELSNWTATNENDFGALVGGAYRYNTVSTADVTAGWTQTADDAAAVAVAIAEVASGIPHKAVIIMAQSIRRASYW